MKLFHKLITIFLAIQITGIIAGKNPFPTLLSYLKGGWERLTAGEIIPVMIAHQLSYLNLVWKIDQECAEKISNKTLRVTKAYDRSYSFITSLKEGEACIDVPKNGIVIALQKDFDDLPRGERLYVMGHEIGHYKLGHCHTKCLDGKSKRKQEYEADAYAVRQTLDIDSAIAFLTKYKIAPSPFLPNTKRAFYIV